MGERVGKEKIEREQGYLYYMGKDGYVWATPMKEKQKEGAVKKRVGTEKFEFEKGVIGEDGRYLHHYMYYIDKEAYVARAKMPCFRSKDGVGDPVISPIMENLKKTGVSSEELVKCGVELLRVFEIAGCMIHDRGCPASDFPMYIFSALIENGLIKTPADVKTYGDILIKTLESSFDISFGEDALDSIFDDTLKPVIKMGLVKSPQDLKNYLDEMLRISKSSGKDAQEFGLACFYGIFPLLLKNGLIKSFDDFKNYGNELIRTYELSISTKTNLYDVLKDIEPLVEDGKIKSPEDMRKAVSDFLQSPSKE